MRLPERWLSVVSFARAEGSFRAQRAVVSVLVLRISDKVWLVETKGKWKEFISKFLPHKEFMFCFCWFVC